MIISMMEALVEVMITVTMNLTVMITKVIPTNIIKLHSNQNYFKGPSQDKTPGTATPQFEIPDGEGIHAIASNYADKKHFHR